MNKFKKFLGKTLKFIKKHAWSIALIIVSLAVVGFIVWDSYFGETFTPAKNIVPKKKFETKVQAPLSGRLTEPEKITRRPIAVVVENHPDARPQSGLNQASLVYETFAEGGITRFVAFFHENDVSEIGPIRSARVYFVEWANSYNALFAHVGGNSDALSLINTLRLGDLNQFSLGKYFWRDTKRYAPHNVYSTTDKLRSAATSKKYDISSNKVEAFIFKKDLKVAERPVDFIFTVNFNNSFAVNYAYSAKDNDFKRSIAGKKHLDRVTGEQITAKNVVVCFSEFSNGKSRTGEQKVNIRTTGSGSAIVFVDGKRTEATWKRPSNSSITRIYDASGKEVSFNAGTTWIEFVPTGTSVK